MRFLYYYDETYEPVFICQVGIMAIFALHLFFFLFLKDKLDTRVLDPVGKYCMRDEFTLYRTCNKQNK